MEGCVRVQRRCAVRCPPDHRPTVTSKVRWPAGAELAGYRYLIAVSLDELPTVPADDATAEGVTYRHINIVVKPTVPSKAAKRSARAP